MKGFNKEEASSWIKNKSLKSQELPPLLSHLNKPRGFRKQQEDNPGLEIDGNPASAYSQHTMTRGLNAEVRADTSAGRLLLLSSISELGEHHY